MLSAALFVRMFLTAQSGTHLEETALAVPLGGQTDVTCRHVASVVVSVRLSAEPSMQEGKKHTQTLETNKGDSVVQKHHFPTTLFLIVFL